MVLPEIEEEMEDEDEGQKLSLTSLLLGMMKLLQGDDLRNIALSESSNIVAHIGLGDLPLTPQDTRHNSLTASNDGAGGLSDNGGYGYSPSLSQGRSRPVRGPIQGSEAGSGLTR